MAEWAVARSDWQLDVFKVRDDGGIYTAAWDERIDAPGRWRGWWRITDGEAVGAAVAAVARDPEKLDVFVVGKDGGVWTAAWDQHVAGGQWRGWWPIPGLQDASPVSVVARTPDRLDVFAVAGGKAWTAAWRHGFADGKWRGWWQIGDEDHFQNESPGGQPPVACVSRGPLQLDVLSSAVGSGVRHAAWDGNVSGATWQGWFGAGSFQPASRVVAVSAAPSRIDAFAIGMDDILRHVARDGSSWGEWTPILGQENALLRLSAVASGSAGLHAFMVVLHPTGMNGIAAAHRDQSPGSAWSKLEMIEGLRLHAPRVAAVARGSKVDVFALDPDEDMYTATWHGPADGWGAWSKIDP